MTQHLQDFLQDCTTATADGSLTSLDEIEGLYVYWCSLRKEDALPTEAVLDELRLRGLETVQRSGAEYVEGLLLTGPVMTGFILSCDFSGTWGRPDPVFLSEPVSVPEPVFASDPLAVRDVVPVS